MSINNEIINTEKTHKENLSKFGVSFSTHCKMANGIILLQFPVKALFIGKNNTGKLYKTLNSVL